MRGQKNESAELATNINQIRKINSQPGNQHVTTSKRRDNLPKNSKNEQWKPQEITRKIELKLKPKKNDAEKSKCQQI